MIGAVVRRGDKWEIYETKNWVVVDRSLRTRSLYCFEKNMWVPLSKIIHIGIDHVRIIYDMEELQYLIERVIPHYVAMQAKIREARDIFNTQMELSI